MTIQADPARIDGRRAGAIPAPDPNPKIKTMHPNQWATNAQAHQPTDRDTIEHAAATFAHLIPGHKRVEIVTCGQFAKMIRKAYDQNEPRTAEVLKALDRHSEAQIKFRRY